MVLQKGENRLGSCKQFVGPCVLRAGPLIRAAVCSPHVKSLADYQPSKRRVNPERMGARVFLDSLLAVLLKLPADLPQKPIAMNAVVVPA